MEFGKGGKPRGCRESRVDSSEAREREPPCDLLSNICWWPFVCIFSGSFCSL